MNPLPPFMLRILSPEGIILEAGGVLSVNVPLVDGGGIGIRPGHAPLIAETVHGNVHYQTANAEYQVDIMPGILSISSNVVTILTAYEVDENSLEAGLQQDHEFPRLIRAISQALSPGEENPKEKVA